jgi:predicted flap endonuclease-1-like 5' DNA nuclease
LALWRLAELPKLWYKENEQNSHMRSWPNRGFSATAHRIDAVAYPLNGISTTCITSHDQHKAEIGMLFWLGLVGGLIIGWVIEWIIDWRFWRRGFYSTLTVEQQARRQLEAARQEISRLQAQVAVSTWPAKEATAALVQRDPLEQIDGIGPVFAQRLHQAGIFTFAQLAEATPERVQAAIQTEEWQRIDAASWIAQAKVLLQQQRQVEQNQPNHHE